MPDHFSFSFLFQDSEVEESSNLNAPATPSMSDVDDGEEVVRTIPLLIMSACEQLECCVWTRQVVNSNDKYC